MTSSPNTDKPATRLFGFLPATRVFSGALGNRFVFQILAISAGLSFITSGIQLYAGYNHDRQGMSAIAQTIERSVSSAFTEALWEYNFELVEALLEGVYNKENVEFARLETPQGRVWELGTPNEQHITSNLEFLHSQENTDVGELQIGVSTQAATKRLWGQAWIVLLTNFLKATLASVAISMMFEWNVGRHLRNVSQHVSMTNWQDARERIELDRKRGPNDDIERVVHAIHSAKQRSQAVFDNLNAEIALRTAAEVGLKLRTIELENANREQAEFTYAISHDLKSPTNTIRLLIGELREIAGDNVDEDTNDILGDMDLTTTRMKALIDDVLNYASTVEVGTNRKPVDLNILFDEIVADLKADIRGQNVRVFSSNLPILQGDRTQLRLLLQNLIANAIKFRSTERDSTVQVVGSETENHVVVEVIDNGIGIPNEHFERIFGMFKRLHNQSEYEGTGLGLTLCKRIMLGHDGEISVSSEVGEGTCFRMEFKKNVG